MATDGSDQRELITEGSSAWSALSPDGQTLAFTSTRGDQMGIWRADADGLNARILSVVTDAAFLVFVTAGACTSPRQCRAHRQPIGSRSKAEIRLWLHHCSSARPSRLMGDSSRACIEKTPGRERLWES
jgi:hypothetical protein